jgi:8-oxo-dGTP pyrophosphatase MutT (NUDIX family)
MTTYATGPGAYPRPPRTELERLIWQRRQTIEEFAAYAERFAREHDQSGTLSPRHLQRLAAGRRSDGRALGPIRPATARLLEAMLGQPATRLLAPPENRSAPYAMRVAIAVVIKGDKVLLVRRRASCDGFDWQFPAGVVKPGVEPWSVAIRETYGESRVVCSLVRALGSRLHPITDVICEYFLCSYQAGIATNADAAENTSVAWIGHAALPDFIPHDLIYAPILVALSAL